MRHIRWILKRINNEKFILKLVGTTLQEYRVTTAISDVCLTCLFKVNEVIQDSAAPIYLSRDY